MAYEAIYVKVKAESRRRALQLVRSLLRGDRTSYDHKVFDHVAPKPEVVSG